MRIKLVSILISLPLGLLFGQTSLKQIDLVQGEYKVGFKHYTRVDSTRKYQIKNEFNTHLIYRPIPISIWYPAKAEMSTSDPKTVHNYLEVLKEEEEWSNLPNEFLLDWFHYLWNTPENESHLLEEVNALFDVDELDGKFPVIVYAPSYQASSIENFALCEFLASHGYVVISSPSRGTINKNLEGGTTKDMETQSRDVEFLLREICRHKNTDRDKVALMGFSFGGLSNTITVMKNQQVKALVSLDGTERYRYDVLEQSAYFNLDKLNIPYVHFAQKIIPDSIMRSDQIPAELNHEFKLYDSLEYSDIYRYRFHDLTHAYFSSYGVLFGNRDKRQDKSDAQIMQSYRILCEYVLQFFNAILKGEEEAIQTIESSPDEYLTNALISKQIKKAKDQEFSYKDFNDLAFSQDYKNLIPLYQESLRKHPDLKLEEAMLNKLGLWLSFGANRIDLGINVFLLALHIYPNSANLYDSLAESYLLKGETVNAIENFKRSLKLDPQNQNAIKRLKELQ